MCCIAANGSSFQALAAFNGETLKGIGLFRIRDAYETDAGIKFCFYYLHEKLYLG
jgi:hypothetical protein